MKKLQAFILALGVSASAMANVSGSIEPDRANVTVRKVDNTKVQLIYGMNPVAPVTVKIYDANKFLVQKDRIVADKPFAKAYDFVNLVPGKYEVEVIENNQVIDQYVLDMGKPATNPIAFSKVEKVEENKFKLSYNGLSAVKLDILVFENDKLIHEEQVSEVNGFQKLYKIQGVSPSAKLEFFVKTDEGFTQLLAAK
jgi:hypothetical protein